MNYEKTILCLANSRKLDGRCAAGKEFRDGECGEWIRPVSKRPSEEISWSERRYESGQDPQVLDIISIPMLEPRPDSFQVENHLIDDEYYWEKVDRANWQDVVAVVDAVPGPLWINGFSTWEGQTRGTSRNSDCIAPSNPPRQRKNSCWTRRGSFRAGEAESPRFV